MTTMIQRMISLTAIAVSMASGGAAAAVDHARADRETRETVNATETTIRAVWTCDEPHGLATDATATVKVCHWDVR